MLFTDSNHVSTTARGLPEIGRGQKKNKREKQYEWNLVL
jgi:hypothetical protein